MDVAVTAIPRHAPSLGDGLIDPGQSAPVLPQPIPLSVPNIGPDEQSRVLRCLQDGWVSTAGPDVPAFEREFTEFLGAGHAAAVQTGSAALYLGLRVAGVRPGDVVLCPSLTFIATANAAALLGARVHLVDVAAAHTGMCPRELRGAISDVRECGRRVGAIVPVHLYGHVAAMDEIVSIASEEDIPVVEDATEALGSRWHGRPAGLLGEVGCFSFNGNKLITTGGGGMVVSRDASLAGRARHLAQQARTDATEFEHDEVGFNFRLTNLQAALGRAQLARLPEFIDTKRRVAAYYRRESATIPGLRMVEQPAGCESCYWMITVLVDEDRYGMSARRLVHELNRRRIQARPLFKPLHTLGLFEGPQRHPNAESWYARGLNLPCSTNISDAELNAVSATLHDLHNRG